MLALTHPTPCRAEPYSAYCKHNGVSFYCPWGMACGGQSHKPWYASPKIYKIDAVLPRRALCQKVMLITTTDTGAGMLFSLVGIALCVYSKT